MILIKITIEFLIWYLFVSLRPDLEPESAKVFVSKPKNYFKNFCIFLNKKFLFIIFEILIRI